MHTLDRAKTAINNVISANNQTPPLPQIRLEMGLLGKKETYNGGE